MESRIFDKSIVYCFPNTEPILGQMTLDQEIPGIHIQIDLMGSLNQVWNLTFHSNYGNQMPAPHQGYNQYFSNQPFPAPTFSYSMPSMPMSQNFQVCNLSHSLIQIIRHQQWWEGISCKAKDRIILDIRINNVQVIDLQYFV